MKVINLRKIGEEGRSFNDVIREIIGRVWNTPKSLVRADTFKFEWDNNRVTFGYWIPNRRYPVAVQNEKGQIVLIRKDEYEEYWKEIV